MSSAERLALTALLLLAPAAARAADDATEFKFTAGRYGSSDHNDAIDLNLRASRGTDSGGHTGWVGVYRDRQGFEQWRTGYEFRPQPRPWLRPLLSLQNASGGAWIGAVSSEFGADTYAIAGWGRTNLRNYVNLNFDPNDAITLGVGSRALPGHELTLFTVRDDRLGTGQQITHAVWRRSGAGEQRLTLDASIKRGRLADGSVSRWAPGWSIGYDRGPLFVRYTHDVHAGFAVPTQDRVSLGTRF